MNRFVIGFFLMVLFIGSHAQERITLDDIWTKFTFYTRSVPGFNFKKDGRHYTRLENNAILEYDLTTGEVVNEIVTGEKLKGISNFSGNISSYEFTEDERKILIKSESESIYRRSTRAQFHVYDLASGSLVQIFDQGKIMYATFSPDGNKVAFVKDNNLYYKDLTSHQLTQITFDGKWNKIINGAADWVYEEEFSLSKAFFWSPDSRNIAYLRFDESDVKEFTMFKYSGALYPEHETFKYPKVGEKNAIVSVHNYSITNGKIQNIFSKPDQDLYIPRIRWTNDQHSLCIFVMNRHQNHLQLLLTDIQKGNQIVLLEERNKYYIDIHDDLTFLPNKKEFIWTSEKSGYKSIYLYNMKGEEIRNLTPGHYDVTSFYGLDVKRKMMYYQAATESPLDRQIYSVSLDGKTRYKISEKPGTNSAQFSSTYDYYTLQHSTINDAPAFTVYNHQNEIVRNIENNEQIGILQKAYQTQPVEFFSFNTSENIELNGYMIKPNDFDENKKYPVLMMVYGGPGSQQVTDSWKGNNYWWFQMLAQHGYIIACVDNRGTGARGEEFKKMTYLQLGHYETIDQIEAAKYLSGLQYIDKNRIGIYGWSYGGYMSTNCLLKGNDVFKAAIAVAPVTHWKWYDTIYTERYMRSLNENESGYNANSPVLYADRLKGHYLLIHGMADDNVHFQHTVEMCNALIKANKQFETYFYPNRNHGIYGDNARIHLWTKMNQFIFEKI
ncbi:MAG TPA: S9 family peptidase [Saprospiraceae bacterium]|nr:S9 family peptidase [Saprospiraceae bacterium]